MMRQFTPFLIIIALLVIVGCGPDNTASLPAEYGDSQLPPEPPAMQDQGGGLKPAEPPKLDL